MDGTTLKKLRLKTTCQMLWAQGDSPVFFTVNVRVAAQTSCEMKTTVPILTSVRTSRRVRMKSARITQITRFDNPDACEIGIENLDNAKLSELRLQIMSAINESMGQPLVQSVYLADFSAEVQ